MKKLTLLTLTLFSMAIQLDAQWKQSNGPNGGLITSITSNEDFIFIGTDAGVARKGIGESNWKKLA